MIKPNPEYNKILADALAKADEYKPLITSYNEWISADDHLPEECEYVLVWYEYFRYGDYNRMWQTYGIGYQVEGRWGGDVQGERAKCLYWMPLPKPPKGE